MPLRRYPYVHVDVFTRQPFGGNQLAVFTDARGLLDAAMQRIAQELNFSETAFVFPPEDPQAHARVRIFTPGMELPFAGHPVVGTAYVLGLERSAVELSLELAVGTLKVEVDLGDGRLGRARMEQPLPTFWTADASADELAAMIGLPADDLAGEWPAEFGSAGVPFLYVPVRSLDGLRRAKPEVNALRPFFSGEAHPAVYAFTLETQSPQAAAHARLFSLLLGSDIREDPATGGASGPFGAYLVRHGIRPPGSLLLEQGYEMGRPSLIEVDVEVSGGDVSRVQAGGGVVVIAQGHLLIDD